MLWFWHHSGYQQPIKAPDKEIQVLAGGSHNIGEMSGAQIASTAPGMKPAESDCTLCLAVHEGKQRCCILSPVCETLGQNSFINKLSLIIVL